MVGAASALGTAPWNGHAARAQARVTEFVEERLRPKGAISVWARSLSGNHTPASPAAILLVQTAQPLPVRAHRSDQFLRQHREAILVALAGGMRPAAPFCDGV